MNTPKIFKRTVLLAALAAVAAGAPAQERSKEQPRPTTRSLIEQLGHREFEQRQAAEKQLLDQGKAARAQLERAAKDHEDAEVRWRAQRILRKLDRGQQGERRLRRREPGHRDRPQHKFDRVEEVDRLFEEIFKRLERDLDIDIRDVRRHIERARAEAKDRARDLDVQQQSRSMKMSITPDGVRVETEEMDRDGKMAKKVYEADSMEAFKSKYPEVARRFGIGGSGLRILRGGARGLEDFGLRRWSWPQRDLFDKNIRRQLEEHRRRHQELLKQLQGLRQGQPPVARLFEKEPPEPQGDVPPPGERLGIYASDAPADVTEFLGLEKGQGLRVEEVIQGSLAEDLGIQEGDILFQIGDRKIFAVQDVRKALRRVKVGETVQVKVNRRGRVVALEAKKPAVVEEQSGKTETPKKAKKLKQRGKLR